MLSFIYDKDVLYAMVEVTIPLIILSGLVDGINPCAFAVLFLLMGYLISLKSKDILKISAVYITMVYITYFLAGLGILKVLEFIGIARIVFTVAAIFIIAGGLINIKDFIKNAKHSTLKIPSSQIARIKKLVQKATIPSAIALGFFVSMVELPCTGGIYVAILGLLSTTPSLAIPYLLVYNLAFVAPLIVLSLLMHYGLSNEKLEKWRRKNRRFMRLSMGLLMIILGIIMIILL